MDELPKHIGPYEVRDRLGQGGMGVVYLGFDPMLDRPVAIKVLKVPDEETRRRFLREARLAARVHHPHIVSIYVVGEHEGNPYLAMEFIAGRTMAQVIRGGDQVPLARKVHWLAELCAGLGHAHESGIVHRDVKPSNLLIAQGTDALRLVDFGIAHGNEASSMTMAGMIVGTPQYMSPEQITGQAVDARSDIFSVGAVAYELLTGRQAFGGENLYQVSRQIVGEQPRPIESFVPDIPNALVKTIAKCLQKEPVARAGNAKQLEREFLAIARRLDPEHTLVVLPAEQATIVQPHARDATVSRRELMKEAEQAIEHGELTTASGLLQKLESGTSPSPDVQQLRQKLQARRFAVRLQEALSRADEATQTGTVEEAEAAINALADLSPRHSELERLRKAHQERIDERQVASLTSRARQALQQDRLDEAESLLAEALSLSPDAADALGLQQKLSARTRAQRIARLVAQASRALDQEDLAGARRAVEALTRIDSAHRDVARLEARLAALAAEANEPPVARTISATPVVVAPAASLPVSEPPAAAPVLPAPKPAPMPAVAPKAAVPVPLSKEPGAEPRAVAVKAPSADVKPVTPPAGQPARPAVSTHAGEGLVLRDVSHGDPQREPRASVAKPDAEAASSQRSPAIMAGAALVLLLIAGALYYQFGRSPAGTAPPTQASGKDPGTATPSDPAPVGATPVSNEPAPAADPPPAPAPEPASAESKAPTAPVTPAGRTDPWAAAHQFSRDGKYDRAMAAIEQVKGVPAALMQEERSRVVENARRYALAARRSAEDLRLTGSAPYASGISRQDAADGDRGAGNLKAAVSGYMAARAQFLQAINDSGRPSPPVPVPPVETAPPSNAPETPKQAEPSADLSTWSTEEARAVLGRFQGAYIGRDIGGLRRMWPNMEPTWANEFRDAFATSGSLVCVFENVSIVRTTDQFIVTATLLTQLPGEDQRRRNLNITLVPARDRLVIGNIRVR